MTREEWLEARVEDFRAYFAVRGLPIPDRVKVACGFPSKNALGGKVRHLGECWAVEAAEDRVPQIYITPLMADARKVMGVLIHELVHACLPTGTGHKKPFVSAGAKVGLTEGKATELGPGESLWTEIDNILRLSPPYPHSALVPLSADKKQTTRMLKLFCIGDETPELHEEYVLRGSRKVIDLGLPVCPLCHEQMKLEETE